jgi:uncharacterized membrane protein
MLTGVMLFALVGFALAIDVGYMYLVRHELQRCADSGARAGAYWFVDNTVGKTGTPESRARDYASRDDVAKAPLAASEIQVTVFPADNQVRVDTRRTVNLFFGGVFGHASRSIGASATAEGRLVPAIPPAPPLQTVRLIE